MGKLSTPDLILPALGRVAKWRPYPTADGRPFVAVVHVPPASAESYDHPTVEISYLTSEGTTERDGVEIRFQRHRMVDDGGYGRPAAGFMASGADRYQARSRCYGGTLTAKVSRGRSMLRRVLDLLDRAGDAARKAASARWDAQRSYDDDRRARKQIGCDLVELITGLRRCGVAVHVYNPTLRLAKAKRLAERTGERVARARAVRVNGGFGYRIEEGDDRDLTLTTTDECVEWNVGYPCMVRYAPGATDATRVTWVAR